MITYAELKEKLLVSNLINYFSVSKVLSKQNYIPHNWEGGEAFDVAPWWDALQLHWSLGRIACSRFLISGCASIALTMGKPCQKQPHNLWPFFSHSLRRYLSFFPSLSVFLSPLSLSLGRLGGRVLRLGRIGGRALRLDRLGASAAARQARGLSAASKLAIFEKFSLSF